MATLEHIASGGSICGYDGLVRDDTGEPIIDFSGQFIESDVYFNRGVNLYGSSGSVSGGQADVSSILLKIDLFGCSGGMIAGGRCDCVVSSALEFVGGCVGAGSPSISLKSNHYPSDGIIAGGYSPPLPKVIQEGTGGCVVRGDGAVLASKSFTPSAGAVASAAAGCVCKVSISPSSGSLVGGNSYTVVDNTQYLSINANGGAVSGGQSLSLASGSISMQGGAVLAASAGVKFSARHSAAGGIEVGGYGDKKVMTSVPVSNGSLCGGWSISTAKVNRNMDGGGVGSGSATIVGSGGQRLSFSPSGGAVAESNAGLSCSRVSHAAGGGVSSGNPTASSRFTFVASGGSLISGVADMSSKDAAYASGKVFYRSEQTTTFYRRE